MKKMILAAFVAAMMCVSNASAQSFDGAEFVDNGAYFEWVDSDGKSLTSILKSTAREFGWDGVTTPFYWDRDGNISYSEATAADNGAGAGDIGATFVDNGEYFAWMDADGNHLTSILKSTAREFGWDGVTTPFYWDSDGKKIIYPLEIPKIVGYIGWIDEDGNPVFVEKDRGNYGVQISFPPIKKAKKDKKRSK